MKKFIGTVLCVAMVAACLTGCGGKDTNDSNASDSTAVVENSDDNENTEAKGVDVDSMKTFTVGFDADFPPYGYKDDNGEYVGFDLDLAAEVAKRNGWEIVYQPIDWNSKDMELSSGSIDCIWNGFTMSEDRVDKYAWSDPYVDNSQVIVVAKDSGITSLTDLSGKVVLVQADSSALEALNNDDNKDLTASFSSLDIVADYNTAFMTLESGAADAVAMDIGVAEYQISSRNDEYIILSDYIATEQYGIGFSLENSALRDKVQETLNDMVADGTFDTIAKKWDLTDSVCLGK